MSNKNILERPANFSPAQWAYALAKANHETHVDLCLKEREEAKAAGTVPYLPESKDAPGFEAQVDAYFKWDVEMDTKHQIHESRKLLRLAEEVLVEDFIERSLADPKCTPFLRAQLPDMKKRAASLYPIWEKLVDIAMRAPATLGAPLF